MKVLVTGAAGFIGSHLVDRLIHDGHQVLAVDNLCRGTRESVNPKAEFHEIDIRNPLIQDLFRGVDAVFHQAALNSIPYSLKHPREVESVNVDGFKQIIRSCELEGVKKLVYASSSSVYGDSTVLPRKEDFLGKTNSPYAESKRINELMAAASSVTTIGLRYFNVFGPRQRKDSEYSAVIPKWIDALLTNKKIIIHGDGTAVRDFTYIDNVIEANILASQAIESEVYNIGTGEYQVLNNVLCHLINFLKLDKHEVATRLTRDVDNPPPVLASFADISRARFSLGYEPYFDFLSGLKKTVEYFAQEKEFQSDLPRCTGAPSTVHGNLGSSFFVESRRDA